MKVGIQWEHEEVIINKSGVAMQVGYSQYR